MSQVTFFLLDQDNSEQQLEIACALAAQSYRARKKCLVLCEEQTIAEQFDELLWALPADGFVPHNLTGEGPQNGTPVEISWQAPTQFSRQVLINLTNTMPESASRFRQIYDFVPAEEHAKQQARERYKHYRAAGHQLDTRPASSVNESNDG